MMLLGQTFFQKRIVNGTRKWYVNNSIRMNVTNLGLATAEFLTSKPMRMNRNQGPLTNFSFQCCEEIHSPPYTFLDV